MVEIIRLSGYRLKGLPPDQAAYKWAALRNAVMKYLPLFQELPFGYYLDDGSYGIPAIDLLMGKLAEGEIYLAFSGQKFIGLAAITDIAWGRNAYIEAVVHSSHIGSLAVGKGMGEIFTYAFQDFGQGGLGLKKLKATVAAANMRVIKMLVKVGFRPAGLLQGEALHGGIPHDMILLEYLNPKYFQVDKQVISNDRLSTQSTNLSTTETIHATPSTDAGSGEHTSSIEPVSSDATGSGSGSPATQLASTDKLQRDESISAGGTGWPVQPESNAANEQLVHAEPSDAASSPSSVPDATRRPKLRKLRRSNGRANASAGTTRSVSSSTVS